MDNTLLDNDHVIADLKQHLKSKAGLQNPRRYWAIFDELRTRLGYADYLGALQGYRNEHPRDLHLLSVSRFLINYPFVNRLFPGSLDVLERVRRWGMPVILSDGDVVFQPHKVDRSGLSEAVRGHVLIYVHKQDQLRDVQDRYPADHYVLIDDKLRILTAVKKAWERRVTTIFVRQGHYAMDPKELASYPEADTRVERIGDLMSFERRDFSPNPLGNGSGSTAARTSRHSS